jgi:hypothetical protein
LQDHVARIEQFIDILDDDALDRLRGVVNRVTTLELRGSGKFVRTLPTTDLVCRKETISR